METDTERVVLEYLKRQPMGATVTDIADKLGMSRTTTVKYLEVMRATGLLDYKEVGMAKLWYVSTKLTYAQHVLLEKTRQLVEAIETPDEHYNILQNSIQPHLKIISTYPEKDRKKFSGLFRKIAEEVEKGEKAQ
jgi:predicted ArsR family transcriptional regulator